MSNMGHNFNIEPLDTALNQNDVDFGFHKEHTLNYSNRTYTYSGKVSFLVYKVVLYIHTRHRNNTP